MKLLRLLRHHPWVVFCCVAAMSVLLVHGGSLRYTFVSDDYDWLTQAEINIQQHHIATPLSHPIGGNFYRPLPALSFTLDAALAGRNAAFFHADQLFMFFLLIVVIAWMLDELFHRRLFAYSVALLFAVYPAHHEVVSWLAGRPDLLAALWMVTSCIFLLRVLRTRAKTDMLVLCIATTAAYMSKESALILPALHGLVLLTRYVQDRTLSWRRSFIALLPSVLLLAVLLFVRSQVLTDAIGGYQTAGQATGLHIQPRDVLSPIISMFSLLNLDYLRTHFTLTGISFIVAHIRLISFGIFVTLLSLLLIRIRTAHTPWKRILPLAFGTIWAYVAFIPGLGLSSAIGSNLEGSRLFFTPSLGYCVLIISGLMLISKNTKIAISCIVFIGACFAAGSVLNAQPWREASATVLHITALFRQEKIHLVREDDTDVVIGGLPGKVFGAYAFWGPHIDRAILQTEIGKPLNVVVTGVTPFVTSPFCRPATDQHIALLHWNTSTQRWEREQERIDTIRQQAQSSTTMVLQPSSPSWSILNEHGAKQDASLSAFDSSTSYVRFSVPSDFYGARYRSIRINLHRSSKLTGYGSRQATLSWQVSPTTERQVLTYTLQPDEQSFTIPLCQYPNWALAQGALNFDLHPGRSGQVSMTSIELLP